MPATPADNASAARNATTHVPISSLAGTAARPLIANCERVRPFLQNELAHPPP